MGLGAVGARGDLADARAYEIVSPADKNGGDVDGDGQGTVGATDGNAVAYSSRAGFADTHGSGGNGQTQYVARRTTTGWVTHSITPTPAPEALQLLFSNTFGTWFSDHLTSAIVAAYDLPAVSDDVPQGANLYQENLSTGGLQTLSMSEADPVGPFDYLLGPVWGSARDGSHVALVDTTRLTSDPTTAGVPNVYDWSGGVLRLAGVLPNGSIPPGGSDMQPQSYRATVSQDGSRLLFVAAPSGSPELYMRIDNERTVQVSQSESVPDPTGVALEAVSEDGQHVLFTTNSQLLPEDTNAGGDLYEYNDGPGPFSDAKLRLVSQSGTVGDTGAGSSVLGLSSDGSKVFFHDDPSNTVFFWDNGTLTPSVVGVPRQTLKDTLSMSITASAPGMSRVSDDGNVLAFLTDYTTGLDGVHALTGEVTDGHMEAYVFDARTSVLSCISCPKGGTPSMADATIVPRATHSSPEFSLVGTRPRFLSADGKRVFFATADKLVPQDVNGVADVYEYSVESGTLSLISTGRGDTGAWFADASQDGNDVFLLTRQRLVSSDRDGLVDLYDARVGGGFAESPPTPSPCVADECQGPSGSPPGLPVIGSLNFDGIDQHDALPVRLRVGRSRMVVGSGGLLAVHVPTAGRLTWSGTGLHAGTRSTKAGSYRVHVTLTARARSTLRKRHVYRTTLTLAYSSADGSKATARVALEFKTRKGRGR
jgi:hypothetical protein